MLSANHGEAFHGNIPILALTKTQTIFDAKEQIGLAFEKQFRAKFTSNSQTLTSSSCKATQPQLQVVCDLGLIQNKWKLNAHRF